MMFDVHDKDMIEAADLGFVLRITELPIAGHFRHDLHDKVTGRHVYTGYSEAEIRAYFAGLRYAANAAKVSA